MEGTVRALHVFRERGHPGESVDSALFQAEAGMEGDCHASGGEQQVTLLAGEARDWMKAQTEPGLCFRRYRANIETENFDTGALAPGTVLKIGTAVLRVSSAKKHCFPECRLFQNGRECFLSQGALFLQVIQTGEISKNDKIMIGGVESEAIRKG